MYNAWCALGHRGSDADKRERGARLVQELAPTFSPKIAVIQAWIAALG